MKKWAILVALFAIVAVLTGPALAGGKGGGSTTPAATITFASVGDSRVAAPTYGNSVWFSVDPVKVKDKDLYHLWVSNVCWQGGVPVLREDLGVDYPAYRQGLSGSFSLDGGSWTGGAATCTASVYVYGSGPLPGATFTYDVGA